MTVVRLIVILVLVAFLTADVRSDQKTKIRVASISLKPVKFDLKGNASRLEASFRKAKEGGARLAVAPEGALDGYVVNEIISGSVPEEKMLEVAVPIDGAVIGRFRKLARELELCMVFGFAERMGDDVYNCAVFIDHRGEICGTYHKMQFAEGYDPDWWFNRLGRASRAFDTPFGRCGMMICNDRWNPDLARIPVLDGARYLLIPAFGSRSRAQDEAVLGRARENGVPVVEANVGVSLVIDEGHIAAVGRREEGITFGEITIPPRVVPQPDQRDALERRFLEQRRKEMAVRLERTRQRLRKSGDAECGRK